MVLLLSAVEFELRRAGVDDGLPDLLLGPAILAHVLGEDAHTRRWTTAMRLCRKPTQSLPATALYRQLRQRVGLDADHSGLDATEAVYRDARAWLARVSEAE